MPDKRKIYKIIAVAAAVLAVVGCVAVAGILNFHTIYAAWEKKGLSCKKREVIELAPDKTTEISADEAAFNQSLMLVNTENKLPDGYSAEIAEYNDTTVFMDKNMLESYAKLSAAVREKTSKKLYVSSDFRTADEQKALYDEDPLTATLPGASEHQTGLALDVYAARYAGDAFLKSKVGRFVNSHCWEYGFIIRYPSFGEESTGIRYEPWHIRYVGLPHSDIIYNNRLTLEEYIESLEIGKYYTYGGYVISRQIMTDGKLTVPDGVTQITVSPDNTGCYVITAKK